MSSPEVCKASLIAFEKQFHTDVFKWIQWKLSTSNITEPEILEFSADDCVFSHLLAQTLKAKRLVTAVRSQPSELIDKSIEIRQISGLSNDKLGELDALGKYDAIIVHEVTHEVEDLVVFLQKLKTMLKSDDGRIFVLAHPKNPPPPIPDVAVGLWRKLAPNREEVILAAKQGGLGQVCYAASCPIKIAKQEWYNILKTRCFPAVKQCAKCTDKEMRDYVNGIRMWVLFEEKILIFLVTPRPEQGDAMEKELEPSTRNPQQAPELLLAKGTLPPTEPANVAPASNDAPSSTAPIAPTAPLAEQAPTEPKPSDPPQPAADEIPAPLPPPPPQPAADESPAPLPSPPDPRPDNEAGAIKPLTKADEKAAGVLTEKVIERAQLKTQPSVADDFPTGDSDDDEE